MKKKTLTVEEFSRIIFDSIKKNGRIHQINIYTEEGYSENIFNESINRLAVDYELIKYNDVSGDYILGKNGEAYKSANDYVQSLRTPNFTIYQKVYLVLYGLFGLFGICFGLYKYYSESNHNELIESHSLLEGDYDSLKLKYDALNLKYGFLEEQKETLLKQGLNDTL